MHVTCYLSGSASSRRSLPAADRLRVNGRRSSNTPMRSVPVREAPGVSIHRLCFSCQSYLWGLLSPETKNKQEKTFVKQSKGTTQRRRELHTRAQSGPLPAVSEVRALGKRRDGEQEAIWGHGGEFVITAFTEGVCLCLLPPNTHLLQRLLAITLLTATAAARGDNV